MELNAQDKIILLQTGISGLKVLPLLINNDDDKYNNA